jgi:hypothetical protein
VRKAFLPLWIVLSCCAVAFGGEDGDAESSGEAFVESIDLSGLFYLSYEYGESDFEELNRFFVNRAYFTAEADILPFLSGRITFDASQDLEGQGRGDMEVRLKYAFAKFHFGDWRIFRKVYLEAGIVHMVWLDFEEHVNLYRMRAPMFMERSGIFNSADFGITLAGGIGPDLDEEYRSRVNSKYAARHGSFAVGVYNGTGYHGDEQNSNKAFETRVTWRPMPDSLPGFQVAGLAIIGKGNQIEEAAEFITPPDWNTYNLFFSYEFPRGAFTAQYVSGEGNQRGTWVEPDDWSQAQPYSGYSFFAEWRFGPRWRVIGGYDRFDRESKANDFSFVGGFAAVGYDFGKANILMLDAGMRDYVDPQRSNDWRVQVVQQLKF